MQKITLQELKSTPLFWSRLGFGYDPPMKDENGKPLLLFNNFEELQRYHADFQKAGITTHTSILHSGWMDIDTYDYSLTDRTLDALFSVSDDIFYIPRIKLNSPITWCKAYPEEVFCYHESPRTKEEIRAIVGTLSQDILGYEAKNGYYAPGFHDPRPNTGGVIALQSLSSKQWLRDASAALERLIDHIENAPYADRIVAYHIGFGPSGENMHWGRPARHYGDYGIAQLRNFYDFGLGKYKTEEALRRAWSQPNLTRDTVILPSPAERYDAIGTYADLFRHRSSQIVIDYDEFLSENVADAMECFGKIVKERTGKLYGGFCGYYLYCDNAAYAGHLALSRLLSSPYVDFLAAPMTYDRRLAGEPGGDLSCARSINRKKLWINEIDCRTYAAKSSNPEDFWLCKNKDEVSFCLWREGCKDVSNGSASWLMDLGGGWFDDPAILSDIQKMTEWTRKMRALPNRSAADILIVTDEKAMYGMNIAPKKMWAHVKDFIQNAVSCGTLCDLCRLDDLFETDLSSYRMIVFAGTYTLTQEILSKLKISTDTTLVFNDCIGCRCGKRFSLKNAEVLTGFSLSEYYDDSYGFPLLLVDGEKLRIAEKTVNGRRHVLCAAPFCTPEEIRAIAERAECRTYAPCHTILYGTEDFLGVFAEKTIEGTLFFPTDALYEEITQNESTCHQHTLSISLREKEFRVFVKKS